MGFDRIGSWQIFGEFFGDKLPVNPILAESTSVQNNSVTKDSWPDQNRLPSGKLTWQWKTTLFNRKYIFKGSIFHCYVRLPGYNWWFQPKKMLVSQEFFPSISGWKSIIYKRLTSKASETRPQMESASSNHWFSGAKLLLVSGRPTATLRINVHVRFQLMQSVATHRIFTENQTSLTWIIHTIQLLLKKSCTTWDVSQTPVNNGISTTNLNWFSFAGFLVAINRMLVPHLLWTQPPSVGPTSWVKSLYSSHCDTFGLMFLLGKFWGGKNFNGRCSTEKTVFHCNISIESCSPRDRMIQVVLKKSSKKSKGNLPY